MFVETLNPNANPDKNRQGSKKYLTKFRKKGAYFFILLMILTYLRNNK